MTDRKIFAVAGRPVLHSLSRNLFHSAFRGISVPAVYTRISAAGAGEALRFGRELGLGGMNVTAPLKASVFALLEKVDETAEALGAVNTIVLEGRQFSGFNTDPEGAVGALEDSGIDLRGKRCCVLGAGGAGRAAVLGLRGHGAEVVLCNRTSRKALQVARKFGAEARTWEKRSSAVRAADILISTLPPDVEAVRPEWLRPDLVVLEAAYPAPPLSRAARSKGCRVIPGEEWLFRQAVPSFRLFMGSEPDVAAMERAVKSYECGPPTRVRNVSLVGFMGSGKTVAGRLLAEKSGWEFRDTDAWVESRTGQTIAEIFRSGGEALFRKLEKDALREIFDGKSGVICACGGGSIRDGENRALVAERSTVIWLHASLETCRGRIDASTRPLLDLRAGPERKFEDLFRARVSCYAEAADIVVSSEESEDRTVETIHEEIHRVLAD
jgi:shikimate dehydrogenase